MKDIEDMNGVMGACVGIVDAISAGQHPEVKEKVRKRTVREVASFVRLFKKAGTLVAFLDGRRREIQYDPKGQKVAAVMLRSNARLTTDDVAEIVKRKGSMHGLVTPLGYGIVVYPIDLPKSAQGRVGTPSRPGAPLTEPDLWASHPALRDAGVPGTQSRYSGAGVATRSHPSVSIGCAGAMTLRD